MLPRAVVGWFQSGRPVHMAPLFFPINTRETKRVEVRAERRENEERRGGRKKEKKQREEERRKTKTRRNNREKGRRKKHRRSFHQHRRHWPSLTIEASPGKPSAPLAFVSSLTMQDVHSARLCR